MRWKLVGIFPDFDKCIIIVVPHTHWYDFPLGIIVRKIINREVNYIGKKELFKKPYGSFFRWLGGKPVDRFKNSNIVDAVTQIFKENDVFRLALAPEGTRKKVKTLKTGFYYIAKKANVPIVMVAFDYGKKEVKFSKPFWVSNNIDEDFKTVKAFYKGVEGKIPEYSFS